MLTGDTLPHLITLRREVLVPVADAQKYEIMPETALHTPPMVLMLGNHSSGKSSLINHLLGQRVQRTGVAPTDDGFTVLFHGHEADTLDGATLTTDPRFPFDELQRFGPGLTQHFHGRQVNCDLLEHVWLVDSPGMIDSGSVDAERPYDFQAVIRWFAERADLILLFFDPEKPGTTGETLSTLIESLASVDHKLRIVMNKMDLFDGIRDFARTYGALCWNLSRALPTKDLPHIYTTVIPELVRPEPAIPLEGFAAALLELESYLTELPRQHHNTAITRVYDDANALLIRTRVIEAMRKKVKHTLLIGRLTALGVLLSGSALTAWFWYQQLYLETGLAAGGTMLATIFTLWIGSLCARHTENTQGERLDLLFHETHAYELAGREHADDLHRMWHHVRPGLQRILHELGLSALKRVSNRKIKRIKKLIDEDLPALRR